MTLKTITPIKITTKINSLQMVNILINIRSIRNHWQSHRHPWNHIKLSHILPQTNCIQFWLSSQRSIKITWKRKNQVTKNQRKITKKKIKIITKKVRSIIRKTQSLNQKKIISNLQTHPKVITISFTYLRFSQSKKKFTHYWRLWHFAL